MAVPVVRRYTLAAPAALNVFNNATDDVTTVATFLILNNNQVQDIVNDPDPAAGLRYEFVLNKNGMQTPVSVFSTSISPTTAGRMSYQASMSAGNYIWTGAQRQGALTATSFIVKYGQPLN